MAMKTAIAYTALLAFLIVILVAVTAAFHFYTKQSVALMCGALAWYATSLFLDWMRCR